MPAPRDVRASLDAVQSRRRWRARQMQVLHGWEARREARAKSIADPPADVDVVPSARPGGSSNRRHRREGARWSRQLCLHEWMVSPPDAMAARWRVAPRPLGPRCVLVSRRNHHVDLYDARGQHLGAFRARLPDRTVLEAVLVGSKRAPKDACGSASSCAWLYDVLCWHGRLLLDCTASFRHFWLQSRMDELSMEATSSPRVQAWRDAKGKELEMVAVAWCHADVEGIQVAMESAQDGLLFVHEESRYEPGMRTPLVLRWKDEGCSPHAKDTDGSGKETEACVAVLRVDQQGRVRADGNEERVLANMDETWTWRTKPDRMEGTNRDTSRSRSKREEPKDALVRFVVHELEWNEGQVVQAKLEPMERAGRGRKRADDITKVVFQYNLRHDPITRHQLLEASARVEEEDEWSEEEVPMEPENTPDDADGTSGSTQDGSNHDATMEEETTSPPDALYSTP